MNDAILVLTTAGSEQQALTIAEELIQMELVACVNIVPRIRSIYRFKGKVFDDEEILLLIKTTENLFDEVAEVIGQMHTYEIPEIISIKANQCGSEFLTWLNRTVHSNLETPAEMVSDSEPA